MTNLYSYDVLKNIQDAIKEIIDTEMEAGGLLEDLENYSPNRYIVGSNKLPSAFTIFSDSIPVSTDKTPGAVKLAP